jgi:hypothetical protein
VGVPVTQGTEQSLIAALRFGAGGAVLDVGQRAALAIVGLVTCGSAPARRWTRASRLVVEPIIPELVEFLAVHGIIALRKRTERTCAGNWDTAGLIASR